VLKENVTFEHFIRWSDYEDDKSIGRVEFECTSGESMGNLVVYTMTHNAHGSIASRVVGRILNSIQEYTDQATSESIGDCLAVDCLVPDQGNKPTSSLMPKNLTIGGAVLPRFL
jgi:hypothetical protein